MKQINRITNVFNSVIRCTKRSSRPFTGDEKCVGRQSNPVDIVTPEFPPVLYGFGFVKGSKIQGCYRWLPEPVVPNFDALCSQIR